MYNAERISELCKAPANKKAIIGFCKEVMLSEAASMGLDKEKLRLKTVSSRRGANGSVRGLLINKGVSFTVTVNIYNCLHSKASSKVMDYFYLYTTICHELNHIALYCRGRDNELNDYYSFLAHLESIGKFNNFFLFDYFSMLFSIKDYRIIKERRYYTSLDELLCMYFGFIKAYAAFTDVLSEKEKSVVETMIDGVRFTYSSMELSYMKRGQPVNGFAKVMQQASNSIKRKPRLLAKYPQFNLIFTENGTFKSLEDIRVYGRENNIAYTDDILLRLFMFTEKNTLVGIKNNGELYMHMEKLANGYISKCIHYIENKKQSEILLYKDIIDDNTAVTVKNMTLINRQMDILGMKHSSGGVLPLYRM